MEIACKECDAIFEVAGNVPSKLVCNCECDEFKVIEE